MLHTSVNLCFMIVSSVIYNMAVFKIRAFDLNKICVALQILNAALAFKTLPTCGLHVASELLKRGYSKPWIFDTNFLSLFFLSCLFSAKMIEENMYFAAISILNINYAEIFFA